MSDKPNAKPTLVVAIGLALLLLIKTNQRPADFDSVLGTQPITYRIDPNTADLDTLSLLPGVGPPTARKIIRHRETHGPFKTAEDLEKVSGIAAKTRRVIEPWVEFH